MKEYEGKMQMDSSTTHEHLYVCSVVLVREVDEVFHVNRTTSTRCMRGDERDSPSVTPRASPQT